MTSTRRFSHSGTYPVNRPRIPAFESRIAAPPTNLRILIPCAK